MNDYFGSWIMALKEPVTRRALKKGLQQCRGTSGAAFKIVSIVVCTIVNLKDAASKRSRADVNLLTRRVAFSARENLD